MRFIFWLGFAGVIYGYVGYPVIIWILSRLRPRPWKVAPITPSVSVVLAVHNGMALLPTKLENLLNLDYPALREVIVVSDGSTDGTEDFLKTQEQPRLRPILLQERQGKAVAVNAGAASATGEIILFTDLRPEISGDAVRQLVRNFADPTVGCVAGEYVVRQADETGATLEGRLYWRYEQWIRKSEAIFDSPVGVPGCFYAVRRELAVPQPAGIILDDMFEPLSIIRQGYRSVVDWNAYVYDSLPNRIEGEFVRRVRTLAGNFQLLRLAPWTLGPSNRVLFQLLSHKVMRLIVPYLLLLMIVSSVFLAPTSRMYAAFAVIQLTGWLIALLGLRYRLPFVHRIAGPLGALLVLNAAAVAGLYRFLFTQGPLWKIWSSAASREAPGAATESATGR